VASVQTAIDVLATAIDSSGDVKSAIRAVVSAAGQAETTWRQRESTITGAV